MVGRFELRSFLAASLALAVMVGAGVVMGQVAFSYFAAIERISGYRAYSDYDNLDLYRMLDVVEGSEDWKLLYQSDYESHVSYKYTLRNKTEPRCAGVRKPDSTDVPGRGGVCGSGNARQRAGGASRRRACQYGGRPDGERAG